MDGRSGGRSECQAAAQWPELWQLWRLWRLWRVGRQASGDCTYLIFVYALPKAIHTHTYRHIQAYKCTCKREYHKEELSLLQQSTEAHYNGIATLRATVRVYGAASMQRTAICSSQHPIECTHMQTYTACGCVCAGGSGRLAPAFNLLLTSATHTHTCTLTHVRPLTSQSQSSYLLTNRKGKGVP